MLTIQRLKTFFWIIEWILSLRKARKLAINKSILQAEQLKLTQTYPYSTPTLQLKTF